VLREIGVDTGGSNIQFAINPANGDVVVIEMNPRVSRSSALASKATGFPIAKIAARLAVGYSLDEIVNDITGATPACFEPTIDYVVTKIPRFAFEKFRGSTPVLTTSMKSVGEAMAIGRCFEESFQKALRSLETGHAGWGCDRPDASWEPPALDRALRTPTPDRIFAVREAMVAGRSDGEIPQLSALDPWFLAKLRHILEAEQRLLPGRSLAELEGPALLELKQLGFSDRQLAWAIAGYSKDGKANGTKMSVQAISKFFGLGMDDWEPKNVELPEKTEIEIDGNQRREYSILAEAILSTYDIENDDDALRESPHLFEKIRGDYKVRREFDSFTINARNTEKKTLQKLEKLGFKIKPQ